MPRVTRAALRSIEHQDGLDTAAMIPLPQTPKDRVPLGETTGNKGAHNEAANTSEEQEPAKKGTGKVKKGNAGKKASKRPKEKAEEVRVGILEDETQSIHSSAAEEACQDLLKGGCQEPIGTDQVIVDNDRPHTPPSAAAKEASRQLSPKPTTPSLKPEMHESEEMTKSVSKDEQEDSFVAKIETRTPLKMTDSDSTGTPLKEESDKDDSFVDQIKARTPGKRITRIEDSVEALDALEEEIEKVGGLIPASDKTTKQAKSQSTTIDSRSNEPVRTEMSGVQEKKVDVKRPSTARKPPKPRPSVKASNSGPRLSKGTAHLRPVTAIDATGSTINTGHATSQAVLKKRISSVHKAPFQPMKSTKPPTRPNFELPGDAVARKLKEQREERSKCDEEEAVKPRVFKARPVRLSHAPEVKLTLATKARLSMAKGERLDNFKPAARPPTAMATGGPNKGLSTLSGSKRPTAPTPRRSTQTFTNGPTRFTRGPSMTASTTIRAPSALGANRPAPTAEESAHQKLKGKEVFGRTKAEIAEREKAKKEKEDAARKARAEAAERGRIASRAWAEKQKARKLEAGKVNEHGKAVGA